MATVRKLFSFDDQTDKDILKYLDELPNKRQSEFVRQSLRLQINGHTIPKEEVKEDVERFDAGDDLFAIQG